MKKASIDELLQVQGMNRKVAENIYNFFRLRKDKKQMIIYETERNDRKDDKKSHI